MINSGFLNRTELLLGVDNLQLVATKRVIIFGVGGVGSWCAECLVRSGVHHLTIVDADYVCETNVNRQLMATHSTIGQVKVDALKQRLLDINPDAEINALQKIYSEDTVSEFDLDSYDYIIDAIDSMKHKIHLIQTATKTQATFYSSMGAALKMDPSRIKVAEFWKVQGCPLGSALRSRMRKENGPSKKFMCVYSDEVLDNKGKVYDNDEGKKSQLLTQENPSKKAQVNGTLMHITAIFGLTIASLVIRDICQ